MGGNDIELGRDDKLIDGSAQPNGQGNNLSSPLAQPISRPSACFNFLLFLPELDDPESYSIYQKSLVLVVIAVAASAIPLSSTILFPAFKQIEEEFHVSPTLASLTVSLFYVPTFFSSLWWMELVRIFGRRKILLLGILLNLLACMSCALAINIEMLLIFRLLGGAGSSSASVVATQMVYDMFEMKERGRAIGWLVVPPLLSPLLAPIVGGALTAGLGWRASMWFLVIMCGTCLISSILVVPETCRWTAETPRPYQNASWPRIWFTVLASPITSLKYLRFPPTLIASIWGFFPYMVQYMINISIENAFANPPYSYSAYVVGALYAPSAAGYMIGSAVGGHWSDAAMIKSAKKRKEAESSSIPQPVDQHASPYRVEDRVQGNAVVGLVCFMVAMVWYGWTAQFTVHIAAQLCALFLFGYGCSQTFVLFNVILMDSIPEKSGEMFALITGLRGGFVGIGSVATPPLIAGIGNGWTFTMLAFIAVLISPLLIVYRRGSRKWYQQLRNGHYNF